MMINKKELRIGNLVFVDGHREIFFTILQLKTKVAVVKGYTTFQAEYEILTPVQLNKKILEQHQFIGETFMEKKVSPGLILCLSVPDDSGQYQLSLIEELIVEPLAVDAADIGLNNSYPAQKKNSVRLLPIRYFHQLQNTYFEIGGRETV